MTPGARRVGCMLLLAAVGGGCAVRPSATGGANSAGNPPVVAPEAPPSRAGLVATFEDGKVRVVTLAASPNFTLTAAQAIHPAVAPAFSATFTGVLRIAEANDYRLWAAPAVMTINGTTVGEAPVHLEPGVHPIVVTFRRAGTPARVRIDWASPAFVREPVPAALFEHETWPAEAHAWQRVDRGRGLFDELGCRTCHAQDGVGPQAEPFVDVTRRGRGPGFAVAGKRLNPGWIYRWLENPRAVRASAKMPMMALDAGQRADVTAYLASLTEDGGTSTGMRADSPADKAATLSADDVEAAQRLFDTVGCTACHGEAPGLVSLQGVGSKFTPAGLLERIERPSTVEHTGRMPQMVNGSEAVLLARWLGQARSAVFDQAPPTGDAARGRKVVLGAGCLGCHIGEEAGIKIHSELRAVAAETLRGARGCLSDNPPATAPRYPLAAGDRAALLAFLESPRPPADAPLWELARALDSRRCRSCHEYDSPPQKLFDDKLPLLRDVGHKLRAEWISRVVGGGSGGGGRGMRLRPWLRLRMPAFHRAGEIGPWLAAAAGEEIEPEKPVPLDSQHRSVQEGVQLLGRGEGGLSCVTCHRFGSFDPASATPAPDMTSVAARVRPEWFSRWLRDPLRLAPGTQMPAFFSGFEEDFTGGRISSLWAALALGDRMPTPIGVDLAGSRLTLDTNQRPVVMRTFLEKASTRSIAVGFPEQTHFAFDAEACRLQQAWAGDFLDMKPAWGGRGGDEAIALGKVIYRAPAGALIRIGSQTAPSVARWTGYSLARNGVPTFSCAVDGAAIRERITPSPRAKTGPVRPGLVRRIEVRNAPGDVWLAVAAGPEAEITVKGAKLEADGWIHATSASARGGTIRFTVTMTFPPLPPPPPALPVAVPPASVSAPTVPANP